MRQIHYEYHQKKKKFNFLICRCQTNQSVNSIENPLFTLRWKAKRKNICWMIHTNVICASKCMYALCTFTAHLYWYTSHRIHAHTWTIKYIQYRYLCLNGNSVCSTIHPIFAQLRHVVSFIIFPFLFIIIFFWVLMLLFCLIKRIQLIWFASNLGLNIARWKEHEWWYVRKNVSLRIKMTLFIVCFNDYSITILPDIQQWYDIRMTKRKIPATTFRFPAVIIVWEFNHIDL